uniref:Uncharacterized protein n=1 Tax=Daphnia magna TaxID=35525 RepID=A0A0P6D1N7_9CRUS
MLYLSPRGRHCKTGEHTATCIFDTHTEKRGNTTLTQWETSQRKSLPLSLSILDVCTNW